MRTTEHTIYSNYDVYSDNRESAIENIMDNAFFDEDEEGFITVTDNYGIEVKLDREQYRKSITEERIVEECNFLDSCWFDDERSELKRVDRGNGIIAIADVGRWNGRCCGYKELMNLEDVMYSDCDYECVYVDSNGDLRKDETHHDGTNSILYRYWKEGITETQKDNFKDKCYMGTVTQKDITRYTCKAGVEIADAYGWKVRGGTYKAA